MADRSRNFWSCLDALATALDGDDLDEERLLNELEKEMSQLANAERNEARRKMISIVAQLSRLEVRMMNNHGALRRT